MCFIYDLEKAGSYTLILSYSDVIIGLSDFYSIWLYYFFNNILLEIGKIKCSKNWSWINAFLLDRKLPNPKHSIWNDDIFDTAWTFLKVYEISF